MPGQPATNAYRAPDDGRYRQYAFSGGRSSAYMMCHVVEAHSGLPARSAVLFNNTGKEREETLSFVQRCGEHWGVEVVWVEYRYRAQARGGRADPKHHYAVVDHATASRRGEPFEQLIGAKRRLPNAMERTCTVELKRNTSRRYLERTLGWPGGKAGEKAIRTVIGYRHDEPARWRKALWSECREEYPMVDARVRKEDVERFWKAMPFDLELAGSDWSNCDLCFLKGQHKITELERMRPGMARWWSAQESRVAALRPQGTAGFSKRFTYADVIADVEGGRQGRLDIDDVEPMPCWCGD